MADEFPSKKDAARNRLSSLKEIPTVLPMARRAARRDPEFIGLAQSLSEGVGEGVPSSAIDSYSQEIDRLGPLNYQASEAVLTDSALTDDLVAFTRAGMLFFEASADFLQYDLGVRRALGGSGSVTRTLRINDRIVLETSRLVLQFHPATSAADRQACRERHRLYRTAEVGRRRGIEIAAVFDRSAVEAAAALLEDDAILYAEPDLIEHIGTRAYNDPLLPQQWHITNAGQQGGTAGADVKAEAAWATSTGRGTRLAVIDNGFDTSHADLVFGRASGWFRATSDTLDSEFVLGLGGMPSGDHGTACAGMATARGNNGLGGVGVAWESELTAISCLPDQIGTQTTLARAIGYAADPRSELPDASAADGSDVLVCSLGPSRGASWSLSQTLRTFIEDAAAEGRNGIGLPIFWACTNGNHPIAADEVCSHPDIIAVGRSTRDDDHDSSGFGPELKFLAPGVDVLIAAEHNTHRVTTGTSFAAPCAAGVACLALGTNLRLSRDEILDLLISSCDKVGGLPYDSKGRNDRFGYGRLNAESAVSSALRRSKARRARPNSKEKRKSVGKKSTKGKA